MTNSTLSAEQISDLAKFEKFQKELTLLDIKALHLAALFNKNQLNELVSELYSKEELIKVLGSSGIQIGKSCARFDHSSEEIAQEFLDSISDEIINLSDETTDQMSNIIEKYFGNVLNDESSNVLKYLDNELEEKLAIQVIPSFQLLKEFKNITDNSSSDNDLKIYTTSDTILEAQKWLKDHILIKDLEDGAMTMELL